MIDGDKATSLLELFYLFKPKMIDLLIRDAEGGLRAFLGK